MINIDFSSRRPGVRVGTRAGLALAVAASALIAAPALAFGPTPQDRAPRDRDYRQERMQLDGNRRTREVSDQEHAKYQRERGQNKAFDELFRRARTVGRGEYLGVEPDISSNIYRFKFMRPTGNVVWVDMDGRTGRVLAERD